MHEMTPELTEFLGRVLLVGGFLMAVAVVSFVAMIAERVLKLGKRRAQ